MALIKSISGIRGTIGGKPGDTLSPLDIVKFSAAFGKIIQQSSPGKKLKIVIGRDGRISGEMVRDLVVNTLVASGIDVIDLGLSTTPTVEVAVKMENADAGMFDVGSLPVHDLLRVNDLPTECLANALVTKANPKNWDLAGEASNQGH